MKTRPIDDRGAPLLSTRELSILLGVTEADIRAHSATAGNAVYRLPQEWVDRGIERRREYQQATGRDDMLGAVEYWAGQQ